ncbi:10006_t:CDS:2 [Funneliformis mosseae]|uniref:10006_t:CDS:1 n=1 Tax=Funneliformis mosseae TaxID=27381 RepID=A0A9N9DLG8_FUNMO|nr:10006_t:CDS:2 [Funneliformis mosseae]
MYKNNKNNFPLINNNSATISFQEFSDTAPPFTPFTNNYDEDMDFEEVKTNHLVNNKDPLSDSDDNLEFELLLPIEISVSDPSLIAKDKTFIFSILHKMWHLMEEIFKYFKIYINKGFFYIAEIVDTILPLDSDSKYDSAEHNLFDQLNYLPQDFYSLLQLFSLVHQKSSSPISLQLSYNHYSYKSEKIFDFLYSSFQSNS